MGGLAGAAGGVAAAAVALKRKLLLEAFRQADALSPDRAVSRDDLGIRKSFMFRRLEKAGVLVHCGEESYYLDEKAATRDRQKRLRRLPWLLAAAVVAVAIIWILDGL